MLGAKPSSRAAAVTRSLVSARSLPWPFSALEAVPIESPAMAATSRMVTRRGLVSCGDKPLLHRPLAVRRAGAPKRWAMTGLDAVSRASYLTKENLFLSQFGPVSEPPWPPPAALARRRLPGTGGQELPARQRSNSITGRQYPNGSGPAKRRLRKRHGTTEPATPASPGARSAATTNQSARHGPGPSRRRHGRTPRRVHITAQ